MTLDREENTTRQDSTTTNVVDNIVNINTNEEDIGQVWRLISDTAFSGFQDDSFLVCNSNVISDQVSKWKDANEFATPTFDVSTNANPFVIQTLNNAGCSFVCKNKNEMASVLENGVKSENIQFHHEILVPAHLKFAHANNIGSILFRSEADLKKIVKYAPNASLMLAFEISEDSSENLVALHLLEKATELGKKVKGISLRGSKLLDVANTNNNNENNSSNCRVRSIDLLLQKGKQLGHFDNQQQTHLDVGFAEAGFAFKLNEEFGEGIKMTLDSGSRFVDSAFHLAARVLRKRRYDSDSADLDDETRYTYVLNDGVFGSFGHMMMLEEDEMMRLEPEPLILDEQVKNLKSALLGPSGDDLDVIGSDFKLPEMQVGDWVVFPNAGQFSMEKHHSFKVENNSSGHPELRLFYKIDEDEDDIDLNVANNTNNNNCCHYSFDDLLPEMMSSYPRQ